ncbi:MAG: putative FAD-linked oxidoreductase [candidate division BRC1 bacterium ADurb.BinA364]|nr:MAG: putative FAD-linked oxidoreductase [candidate division BRC1 bacterium ADurb.BinA364]
MSARVSFAAEAAEASRPPVDAVVLDKLRAVVGAEWVKTSPEDLYCASYDATLERAQPEAVVYPGSAMETAAILLLANEHGFAVTPRGAGTNLAGASIPVQGGIVMAMNRLNRIVEINKEDLYVIAEPGVTTQTLADAAARQGLLYPPDPGSMKVSTLGGNVAMNAGGLRGLKYGVTRDYVMGLEVVLPTGEIVKTGAFPVKSVSGYDMTALMTGSEGTLGVIVKIVLKLLPKPEHCESMLAIFADMDDAARTVSAVIAEGVIPSTLEFLDRVTINCVEDFKHVGLPRDAEAFLLIETDGMKEAACREAEKVVEICREHNAIEVKKARDAAERDRIWEARRAALSALSRVRATTILEDATVPRSRIPEMVAGVRAIAQKYNLSIGIFGHAGDGNLHPTIQTDERDAEEMERVRKAVDEIFQLALSLKGTISGEHGVGLVKAKYLEDEFGAAGVEAMFALKRALDPNNVLNPGKMFAGR